MSHADKEVQQLSQELGLSEAELRLNLGLTLEKPSEVTTKDSSLNALVEMFPHIPRADVRATLKENNEDIDRTTEQLLSWDALRSDVQLANEIGARKLHKSAKQARKESQRLQRSTNGESKEVDALADILGVSETEARQLYVENGASVTDAVLAKCAMSRTAVPVRQTQQSAAYLEPENELSGLGTRELQRRLSAIDAQLVSVKERARKYTVNPLTRPLSADAYSELRGLVSDRRDIERALNRETFFQTAVYSRHRIDLHGLTLETAQSVCHDVIREFRNGDSTSLEIVTGAGRHSATGRSVIKEWLRGYLKLEKVRAEELEGSFVLRKKATQ